MAKRKWIKLTMSVNDSRTERRYEADFASWEVNRMAHRRK
jgi:hypothetical protein